MQGCGRKLIIHRDRIACLLLTLTTSLILSYSYFLFFLFLRVLSRARSFPACSERLASHTGCMSCVAALHHHSLSSHTHCTFRRHHAPHPPAQYTSTHYTFMQPPGTYYVSSHCVHIFYSYMFIPTNSGPISYYSLYNSFTYYQAKE